MKRLIKKGFNYQDVISFGNMFLLGNGRFGYRGTLEEFRKDIYEFSKKRDVDYIEVDTTEAIESVLFRQLLKVGIMS